MALLHVDLVSQALAMRTSLEVILPENTAGLIGMDGKESDGKCPVLYLLHGMSDDQTIWVRRTSIERYASEYGIAVVMPTTNLGWYTDMYAGEDYWTYISKELPEFCRKFFPQITDRREQTFAAGLSMGGYGAMKCGLLAPETFSWCASLSGALDVAKFAKDFESIRGRDYWYSVLGPADWVQGSDNDLYAVSERLAASDRPKPEIFMWCGTEDFLYGQNTAMRDHLNRLGYHVTYTESEGNHNWKCWDEKIQDVLAWLPLKH